MVGLPVASEDRQLRISERGRIVQCAAFDDDEARRAGGASHQMCPAFTAEVAFDRRGEIRAPEGFRLSCRVAEGGLRYSEADVRTSSADVLALAAMALRVEYRRRGNLVLHATAVATTEMRHAPLR